MEIKKDWFYDSKIIFYSIISAGVGLGIAFMLFLGVSQSNKAVMLNIYEIFYSSVIVFGFMYPIFIFKGVAPKISSDKLYLNTSNLPFSRKQLLFKGLKPWFILFPTYFLFGAFVNTMLITKDEFFIKNFIEFLANPLWVMVIGIIFTLQFISISIIGLSKNIRWYTIILSVMLFNILLVILSMLGHTVFNLKLSPILNLQINESFYWIKGNTLIFFIGSVILFLVSFKDIEKINR